MLSKRTRDPGGTRERLLRAAFARVYHGGFRATELDAILDEARVTKGALYHHFENKAALGYALVDESLMAVTHEKWLRPLASAADPIAALVAIVGARSHEHEEMHYGCPVNNLAQEMSPVDEGFRRRLAAVFAAWHDGLATALKAGQASGVVRRDVDPSETATFIMAAYEGCLSLAKNAQDARVLRSGKNSLIRYLESLRTPPPRARAKRNR